MDCARSRLTSKERTLNCSHAQSWETGDQYYRDILDDKVIACKAMHHTAERWLFDREREQTSEFPYYFDVDYADTLVTLFSQALKFHELEMYGQPIFLEPCQIAFLMQIEGWRNKADPRFPRFSRAIWTSGRKQSKTTLIAGYIIYKLITALPASQIFCLATKEEQARIVWKMVRRTLAQADPSIAKQFRLKTHDIEMPQKHIVFKPLGSNSDTLDGLNVSVGVFDEAAAISDPNLFEVIFSSQGSNRIAQNIFITTASEDENAPFSNYLNQARGAISGINNPANDRILAHIYELDSNDDYLDEANWIKANPLLDITVTKQFLRDECELTKTWTSKRKLFLIKHMNVYAGAAESWLRMEDWNDPSILVDDPPDGYKDCVMGLDIGRVSDLTAISLLFRYRDGRRYLKTMCLTSKTAFTNLPTFIKDKYQFGIEEGMLAIDSGDFVSDEFIAKHVKDLATQYEPIAIGYDGWSAINITSQLSREKGLGFKIEPVSQSGKDLNSAGMQFERLVTGKQLLHADSRFLAWQAGNTVIHIDHKGNIHAQKDNVSSLNKIDAIIAALFCVHLDINYPLKNKMVYRSL